ncbi:hypothetical protein PNIG_a0214 [Pseudoalteromonas nigrifaciens]|jgi:hypothetical protein|uniref:Uncharacterized protein n=1 Tax=Pseudoalteromonas nigrifaciens TaxID=28109 RepID=A0AAC9UFD4_9GAMM|nr:hypothetical protein PNIG_a0214 [Pseudoalteromonas nigrifaciens]
MGIYVRHNIRAGGCLSINQHIAVINYYYGNTYISLYKALTLKDA